MAFNKAHHFQIPVHGNIYQQDFSRNVYLNLEESELRDLADAACLKAGHEIVEKVDRPKCHPDTRIAVINDIMSWVDSENTDEKLMWMKGPAGAGKSSIAQTISQRCKDKNKLVSSFFFSRSAGNGRNDGARLVPTIAYQLMLEIPAFKTYLMEHIKCDPAIISYATMEDQFRRLVIEPLTKLQRDTSNRNIIPQLIVVDGLDECKDVEVQERIVKMFASALGRSELGLRCLIASRPELEIRRAFSDLSVAEVSTQLVLDNKYHPDDDIKTYLLSEFSRIRREHPLAAFPGYLPRHWPCDDSIKELVDRSSGQFIYASTVIKYVSEWRSDPVKRLRTIVELKSFGLESPYAELDALYIHVLSVATANTKGYRRIKNILEALIALSDSEDHPMHRGRVLAQFLGMEIAELYLCLSDLHSVLIIPGIPCIEDESIQLVHASFTDFLLDESRSGEFFIEWEKANKNLAIHCHRQIINTESNECHSSVQSINYARSNILKHFAYSGFQDEIYQKIQQYNTSYLRKIVREMLCSLWALVDYRRNGDLSVILESYFRLSRCPANGKFTLVPVIQNLSGICEIMLEELGNLIYTQLSTCDICHDQALFYAFSFMSVLDNRKPLKAYIVADLFQNPVRGRDIYLSDVRSETLFNHIWQLAKAGTLPNDAFGLSNVINLPVLLTFLLQHIKPSETFAKFVKRFSNRNWYSVIYNSNRLTIPPYRAGNVLNVDEINKTLQALQEVVLEYLNRCPSNPECTEQMEANRDAPDEDHCDDEYIEVNGGCDWTLVHKDFLADFEQINSRGTPKE